MIRNTKGEPERIVHKGDPIIAGGPYFGGDWCCTIQFITLLKKKAKNLKVLLDKHFIN